MSGPSGLQHIDSSYARIDTGGGDNSSRNVGKVEVTGSGNVVIINSERPPEEPRVPAPRCPLASPNFVGRVEEQERMWRFFFGDGIRFDQRRVFLLIGMGGCGKTQLARKFMARVYRKSKEAAHLVFYVDATTVETLKAGFVAIAKANGVGQSVEAALAWMSALDKESFLYFDNADDPSINLRDYFPDSDHVRILITTRLRESQQHYGTGRGPAIHLGALSEDEAIELLEVTAGVDPDAPRTQSTFTLIQELHRLPLAIVQAGAAVFKSQSTVDEYLQQFLQLRTSLMDGKRDRVDSKAIDDYPMHVYTTWKLSYDRLSESTATLLRLCARLHHTGIAEDLFELAYNGIKFSDLSDPPIPLIHEENLARSFLESFEVDGTWDKAQFKWTIQEACAFSLISYDAANQIYSIHPLIHDCLQSITPHPSQAAFLLAATIASSWQDQVRGISLVPHVQRILSTSKNSTDYTPHPSLAENLALCFRYAGMHRSAQNLYEGALQELSDQLPPDHQNIMVIQDGLARGMGEDGRYVEAEELHRKVLEMKRVRLGETHVETIRAAANLAATLCRLGRFTEAEEMCREVLEKRQTILGPNHSDTIRALADLADALSALGCYAEAEGMHREALEKRHHILGPNHIDTIQTLAHLASTLGRLGRFTEAEGMHREALEKRRHILGPNHIDTIQTLAHLASTLDRLGRYTEAESMHREALENRWTILGPNHPDTIQTLAGLANTLHSLGRYTEAEGMFREVVEKMQMTLGVDHLHTFIALASLAVTIDRQDRREEALPILQEAVKGYQRTVGVGHPSTIWAQTELERWTNSASRPRIPSPTEHALSDPLTVSSPSTALVPLSSEPAIAHTDPPTSPPTTSVGGDNQPRLLQSPLSLSHPHP